MGMNIVLIGYRGVGKSVVGRDLAERLGWLFLDTDALIEERTGQTIREIFSDHAEEGFRDWESWIVSESSCLDRHVISTGGGAVLSPANVAALKLNGRLVWLTAPPEVLWERIAGDLRRQDTRPARDPAAERQQVRQALEERNPVYARVADVTVSTENRSVESIVEEVLAYLRRLETSAQISG